jgi:16S rRNA (uracil1498-N3)-methyltransferase
MDCFYSPPDNILKDKIIIEGEEYSHLVTVMRKKQGDMIRVVDGVGNAYDVRVDKKFRQSAHCSIINIYPNHNEPKIHLVMGVGILKSPARSEFLVEKVTELGVKAIIPLKTERTIPAKPKTERWKRVALAAIKQSERAYLPPIRELRTLWQCIKEQRIFDLKLIAHEKATEHITSVKQKNSSANSIIILIGPEGGFTDNEVKQCVAENFVPVSLNKKRLRTETAAIVAATLLID